MNDQNAECAENAEARDDTPVLLQRPLSDSACQSMDFRRRNVAVPVADAPLFAEPGACPRHGIRRVWVGISSERSWCRVSCEARTNVTDRHRRSTQPSV